MKFEQSHILFAIFIVLWLVASVCSFTSFRNIQNYKKDLETSQQQLTQATKKLKDVEQRLTKVSNLLGFRKIGHAESTSNVESIVYALDKLCTEELNPRSKASLGITLETQKIDVQDQVAKGIAIDASNFNDINYVKKMVTLEDVWNACIKRVENLQTALKEEQENLTKTRKESENLAKQMQTEIEALQKAISQKRAEMAEVIKSDEEKIEKADQDRKLAHEESLKEKSKLASVERQRRAQKTKYEQEQKTLEERIQELQVAAAGQTGMDRLVQKSGESQKMQDNPDGEILFSDEKSQTAYIDLGRADGVLKGMTFKVFTYGKGGVKDYKAEILVREVETNMSKVGISKTYNSLNPIRTGDKIINPVYDRDKVKYFAIAGKISQKYSMDQVRRLVAQMGGQIEQDISPRTDIIVLAEGFQDDAMYQTAQERGIEMMLESEFLGYLGDIR